MELVRKDGKARMVEKPLLYHYVFVRGTTDEIKKLCSLTAGFSFVLNRGGNGRYVTLTDESMKSFMTIAQCYGNRLPCYQTSTLELEEGDEVEVLDGRFAGLRGTYVPVKGATSGNILVAVAGNLAAVVYDVNTSFVRVLRFAKNTKRAYDQVEAFVPRLFTALRKYHLGESLTTAEISPVSAFCRRFESVKIDNGKLDAKMQMLLMAANRLRAD